MKHPLLRTMGSRILRILWSFTMDPPRSRGHAMIQRRLQRTPHSRLIRRPRRRLLLMLYRLSR